MTLAFVQWPNDRFIRFIEGNGHRLRCRLRLGDFDALDPSALLATYDNIHRLDLQAALGDDDARAVLMADSAAWSAIAYRERGGPWLVATNPWHAPTRQRASIMEEVAHIILEHRPTKLVRDGLLGLPKRTYTPSKEKAAYGVAGAALVPYRGLVPLLDDGEAISQIATRYGVSPELVRMRIKVTRLHGTTAAR